MTNTQESTMMEMFVKMFMEYDEKARIAQEEREEKARIAQKEQNEQMLAIIGMLLDGKSVGNSIPLEKEIGSWTIERLSDEEDEPRDIDMRVEGVWPISGQRMSDVRLHIHSKS